MIPAACAQGVGPLKLVILPTLRDQSPPGALDFSHKDQFESSLIFPKQEFLWNQGLDKSDFSDYTDISDESKIRLDGVRKMANRNRKDSLSKSKALDMGCCKVESLVSVDDRGQMVLPKEIREKANIHPGDKLALISWEKEGEVCCVSLIRAEDLMGMVKGLLGPMMKEMFSG